MFALVMLYMLTGSDPTMDLRQARSKPLPLALCELAVGYLMDPTLPDPSYDSGRIVVLDARCLPSETAQK